ncbi:MAG TPA: FtsX-like permease family protein, partial [Streptosporangiaceae bacterium]|nr:FtsX-like permease family protein [Streptosporangiaceae bacterium]
SAMGAVWLRLRAELRHQWRVWLALAVLLGVIGGIALTAAAGARRTDTAYPRFLRASHAAQLAVFPARSGFGGYFRAVARLPEVSSAASAAFLQMSLPGPGASPFSGLTAEASPAGDDGVSLDRVKVLAGHLFDPADPHAVMISQQMADREHLRPGGTLQLIGYPQQGANAGARHQVRLAFRVSAVVAFTDQIAAASYPRLLLTPAFARTRQAMSFNPAGGALYAVLRPHAGADAFTRQATALAARYRVGTTQIAHLATTYAAGQRAIRPEAAALAIFAGLAGLIALAIIGQLLSRQLALDSAEFPILRGLGMSRSRLAALSLARAAVVTTTGAAVAVVLAVAASPLMPIGPARFAEPDPGVEINLAILGAGFALIAAVPLLVMVPAALRAANRAQGALGVAEPAAPVRPSRLSPALGLAGSVPGNLGVRMAFQPGHGRTAVPVRSALVGTTVAVAAVVAAMVFGASFLALVGTPHLYGQNWAQELNLQAGAVPVAIGEKVLAPVKGLTGYAGGDYGQVTVAAPGSDNGTAVPAIGLDQLHGSGFLTLLAGRAPAGPHEIALGPRTLRTLGMHIGQRVGVDANGRTSQMRIVGSAVFAAFGVGGNTPTDLGTGAVVAAPVLSQPNPPFCGPPETCYSFFLLQYRPGTDLRAAAAQVNRAATRNHCPPGLCVVNTDQRPSDIENFTGVRDTPLILGAVLALLAVGTLAHVLLTGVLRRRRDLAVLKTLGLIRPQLLRLVSWQAAALAAAAL